MKKFQLNLLAAGILAFSLGACSSTNTDTTSGTTTTEPVTTGTNTQTQNGTPPAAPVMNRNSFPVMAASSDLFEIQSSELAGSRALHPAVRVFAKLMRDHHKETLEELSSLAAQKNITMPTTMLEGQQELMEPMSETGIGEKFDRRYMDAQITAHQQAISLYENAATNETDADFRSFAGRTLPKLRDHLALARKAKDALD